ncbi:MAG: FtsQ-type POTRA domain-containing protein [Treponema sp.]|nr:FtsQ-type POTRA domain-containing protein [Treponema sp.]
MSDIGLMVDNDFDYDEDFSYESMHHEKKTDSGDKKIKILKIVFFILCLLLAGELVVYKYVMPLFASPKVTVSGNKMFTADEIAMKLIPMNSSTWLDFNVDEAVSILSSEPSIESVVIEKKFPDKIYIEITERKPVAVTFIVENDTTYPVEIDKSGAIFTDRNGSAFANNKLPIISGIPVEYMAGGRRINSKYRPLIEQINRISNLDQNYFASVAEICVIPKDSGNYELALIPAQSKIKVLTDRSLNEEAIKYMMLVLDVVKGLETDVSEIDMRYGSVSFKINNVPGEE